MNKNLNDFCSIESIVESLFSKEQEEPETSNGNGEGEDKDETVILLDPEIIEELTEEEGEVIEVPTDPDDIVVDDSDMAEESARLGSEIVTMELAMRTAEEFIWGKESLEADTVNTGFLKKFWDWLKKILAKIKEFLLNAFKRVQVWLAGDMRATVKWTNDNLREISDAIAAKGDQVTLKIKKPVKNPSEISLDSGAAASIRKAADTVAKGEADETLVAEMKKISETSVKTVIEEVYGKDVKSESVTLTDFDKAVGGIVKVLNSATAIKTSAAKINEVIKSATDATKSIDKISANKEVDKANIAGIKTLASATQKAISVSSSVVYWKVAALISIVKISKAYAVKAMKANKAAAA